MISQTLREARKYEDLASKKIADDERPAFHLSARAGWMNDPNGFSYYDGKYHMFYQYHPYDCNWGPMHWGHAVSEDLLHWEYLPAALAPDEAYDRDGCFSGSAVELSDGRQLLMYTGVTKSHGEDGSMREIQAQCLAVGNGTDYEKYEANPVLCESDLPEGGSKYDFRDPKIWKRKDGSYSCVVGNRAADGSGQILLFHSPNGFQWKFEKVLIANYNRFGRMWECPDFFELEGKGVLLTSPQEMLPKGFEYHSGNGTLCLIGEYDEETESFKEESDQSVDYGIDFYAPQTVLAPDGRRIMIGWMQNWDTCGIRECWEPWFGQMSLPRELSIRNGRLYQNPIRELETMRHNKAEYKDVAVTDVVRLDGIKGRRIDMELNVKAADLSDIYHKFAIRFAQDEECYTSICFRPRDSVLKVDRKFSGTRRAIIHQRRSKVSSENGSIKLRLILDRFSAEVFANDGEHVMTITLYTPQEAEGIYFYAEGKAIIDVVKYDLI